MMKWIYIVFLFFAFAEDIGAQEIEPREEVNIDDLGDVSDTFLENYFDALRFKGIEEYEKAIKALEKCIEANPEPAYLYFELGKNQMKLKKLLEAETSFLKAFEKEPNRRYLLVHLFENYYAQRKYPEAIEVVKKLIPFDAIYKEELANLYLLTKQYDLSLKMLDELELAYGADLYRKELRKTVNKQYNNPKSEIAQLESKIKKQPKNEQNYLNLIYVYSDSNQKEKAYEVAKRLQDNNPKSELVHLALYKFYLDDNKSEEAIKSMNKVLKSSDINADSKYKVINDFLSFVNKNPQYETELVKIATAYSKETQSDKVFTEIGNYYYKKDQKEIALNYYERGLKGNINDFELIKTMLLLQLDLKRYQKAKEGSELALEIYPSQPVLYMVNGVALINIGKPEEALEILISGVDYVIDDYKMESDFYKQISTAYEKMGDVTKAALYKDKSQQLEKKS